MSNPKAIQPGETREAWVARLYAEARIRVQAIPRLDRAYNRGDMDAYYGRKNSTPCIWDDAIGLVVIPYAAMTKEEVAAYYRGYCDNPSGEKDWY